jgi:hypothetical protein
MLEFMQFETGTSISRYFPPSGTAGFDRSPVSGKRREPAPPPRIIAITSSFSAISLIVKWTMENGKWKMEYKVINEK